MEELKPTGKYLYILHDDNTEDEEYVENCINMVSTDIGKILDAVYENTVWNYKEVSIFEFDNYGYESMHNFSLDRENYDMFLKFIEHEQEKEYLKSCLKIFCNKRDTYIKKAKARIKAQIEEREEARERAEYERLKAKF